MLCVRAQISGCLNVESCCNRFTTIADGIGGLFTARYTFNREELSVGENLYSEDDRRDRRVILQRMDQLDEAHHDSTWIIDGKNPSVERLRKWRVRRTVLVIA